MHLSSPVLRGLLLFSSSLAVVRAQVVLWDIEKRHVTSDLKHRSDDAVEEIILNEKGHGGYFATARLGTPGQNVTLQLDTGSSDTWVPYSGAGVCTRSSQGCHMGSFDPGKSETFDQVAADAFDIAYVDQSYAKGDYFQDDFEISGATVENLTMAVALQTDIPYGLLGLGYAINEASITTAGFMYPNLPIAMQESGLIKTVAYSLWLNDLGASTGNILFGGIDTDKFKGPMTRVDVLKDEEADEFTHFVIPLSLLEATSPTGTNILSNSNWPLEVVLDSGTTLSYLPNEVTQQMWELVGATYNANVDMAVLPCSHADHPGYFSFGFAGPNGPRINITMDELVVDLTDGRAPLYTAGEYEGERVCQFGIQRGHSSPFTLGDTFMRSAYVVYDLENNEVGIAATDFNATKTNIVPFESKGASIPSATLVKDQTATSGLPRATSTQLTAANGFQDQEDTGDDDDRGGGPDGDEDEDDDDAASVPGALSYPGILVMGSAIAYAAFDGLVRL